MHSGAGLCDSKSAIQLFGDEAAGFYGLNYPYIKAQRQSLHDETYGAGVAAVAMAYRSHQDSLDAVACKL